MKREWFYKIYYTFKGSDIKIPLLTAAHNKKEAKQIFDEWNKEERNNNCLLIKIIRTGLVPIEMSGDGYYEYEANK